MPLQSAQFPELTSGMPFYTTYVGGKAVRMRGFPIERASNPVHLNPTYKTRKQVGYLLSGSSPLTPAQQLKLKRELHSGEVKVKGQ